jgi:hypothetical protein
MHTAGFVRAAKLSIDLGKGQAESDRGQPQCVTQLTVDAMLSADLGPKLGRDHVEPLGSVRFSHK